jgi:ADP-ribosylglycohydrolase/sugar/nucleoside kinase (ribokinase family)
MLLVIGNAAHSDLIARVDRVPSSHEVARLNGGPGGKGDWLPGGSAPTVALVASEYCEQIRLWYPLPRSSGRTFGLAQLREARIDVSMCPDADSAARCILVETDDQRLCWSSTPAALEAPEPARLLRGVGLLVVCPEWGSWVDPLVAFAVDSGVPTALVGEIPASAANFEWTYVIANREQLSERSDIRARVLVTTDGSRGVEIVDRERGEHLHVHAVSETAVDTTGAGDTFAGAFLAKLTIGSTLRAAGEEASGRAAAACTVWGARSIPHRHRPSVAPDERARGVLAGVACGDAFGMPNSFLQEPAWRVDMEGGPPESPYHAGYPPGRITDDTEQAIALTNSLRRSGRHLDPQIAADELLAWFDRVGGESSLAVGPSTMRAMRQLRAGVPLEDVGVTGVTNGASMRIAPVGVWAALADLDEAALIDEVAAACIPTHNTNVAISGAAAVAVGVCAGIRGSSWAEAVEAACRSADLGAARGKWVYAPSVSQRIRWACDSVLDARDEKEAARIISELIGAGEPTIESVPAAFAAATYAGGDPHLAIVLSGNLRGDTDTVAAIAGALCGAQSGIQAFPKQWIELVTSVNDLDIDAWLGDLVAAATARAGRGSFQRFLRSRAGAFETRASE